MRSIALCYSRMAAFWFHGISRQAELTQHQRRLGRTLEHSGQPVCLETA